MIEPTESDVGRRVVYRPRFAGAVSEEGVVTSFNERYVFVRYGTQSTSAATLREELEWTNPRRS